MKPKHDTSTESYFKPSHEKNYTHERWLEYSRQITTLKEHSRNKYYVLHKVKLDDLASWRVVCLTKAQVSIHTAIMESDSVKREGRISMAIVSQLFRMKSIEAMCKRGVFRKTDNWLYVI